MPSLTSASAFRAHIEERRDPMLSVGDLLVPRPERFRVGQGTPEVQLVQHWREPGRNEASYHRCKLWTVVDTHDQEYAFRHEEWYQLAGVDVGGHAVSGWLLGPPSLKGLTLLPDELEP